MTQLDFYIPTYEQALAIQDMNEKPLCEYPVFALIELIKDRSIFAQAAAVILLHDFHKTPELSRYFTDVEIQRYFVHIPENDICLQ